MRKHFLVTVSNNTQNLFGIQFLCAFFNKMSNHRVTLLHICRMDDSDMNKSLMEMWSAPKETQQAVLSAGAQKCMRKAKKMLGESRMAIDQMKEKTVLERFGKVKDILNEGSEGLYDAIVLGQRASYALQWIFEKPADGLAQAMIRDANFSTPLWICPQQKTNRRNVLLCVDGSENSLRTVDHVGYILEGQKQHAITLFYVQNTTGPKAADVFQPAKKILLNHRIAESRIKTKNTWGINAAGSIRSESTKYAAVAVGLHGQESGTLKGLNLAGGTTAKLINKLDGAALWCCP